MRVQMGLLTMSFFNSVPTRMLLLPFYVLILSPFLFSMAVTGAQLLPLFCQSLSSYNFIFYFLKLQIAFLKFEGV